MDYPTKDHQKWLISQKKRKFKLQKPITIFVAFCRSGDYNHVKVETLSSPKPQRTAQATPGIQRYQEKKTNSGYQNVAILGVSSCLNNVMII